ncbi:MAG TPA: hypothetical protein VMW54_05275 [Terriglobia bacterium]|nr:hypothetical protein [Terriglobia bacterium]
MGYEQDPEFLRNLQSEVEAFIHSLARPAVVEDEVELFDLASTEWRLTLEFDKLLFEAWNAKRSVARRVEELAYRDGGKLGLFVRRPHARATSVLEFRDLRSAEGRGRENGRSAFRREFVAMLEREYPGWRREYVSNRSDREHSFSTWYTRGLARQGRTAWAFIGLGDDESPAAADSALAFGLIWLDWLRARADKTVVSKLRIYLPRAAVDLNAQRALCLNHRAVQLELYEWNRGDLHPQWIGMEAHRNVGSRLVSRGSSESLVKRHRDMLSRLLGAKVEQLATVADTSGGFVSVRVEGLEVARVEGDLSPRVYFGLEGSVRRLDETGLEEFQNFISLVLSRRNASCPDASDEFYRLQSERWLESLLVKDITKIDPGLSPDFVYPQVPAFSRTDRGVIDILSASRSGRLAVIELKLHEEINLPFQALDYWLRVEAIRRKAKFQDFGYFAGLSLADAPPLLYLIAPAFRFHSTTSRLLRYLDPAIAVIQVGINNQWRQGIKILFRRDGRTGA